MNNHNISNQLFLASSSYYRKKLLSDSKINFSIISQTADESQFSLNQSIESLVFQLSILKMDHIVFPVGVQGQISYFLTADTMTLFSDGRLYGKPLDRNDAIRMLKECKSGTIGGTAFCLDRKIFDNNCWVTQKRIVDYDQASFIFDVPDSFIDFYLDNVSFMDLSGAIAVNGFGEQFVKQINGCYSAIFGLPMYKLRNALFSLGFYLKK